MILAVAFAWGAEPPPSTPDLVDTSGDGPLAGGAVHGFEEFRLRYYQTGQYLPAFPDNPVLDYVEAVNRLGVHGGNGAWTMSAQGDAVVLFENAYILDDVYTQERTLWGTGLSGPTDDSWFALEKFSVANQGKHGSVVLGDTYASFGKGIALNLVNNADIDLDTTVRGVKGVLSFGDVEVTALSAQTNPEQVRLENPNIAMQPDYPHTVNAVRVDDYGRAHLGLHGVMWQFAREAPLTGGWLDTYGQSPDAEIAGATVDAPSVGPFDLSVEGDGFFYQADEIAVDHGYFLYGSATAYAGSTSVLVELKRQKDAEYINTFVSPENYEIATGPSLEYERVITEDSSAAVNSNDLTGGRVRVDIAGPRTADASLSGYGSVAGFRDDDLTGLHFNTTPETIAHVVGGLTWIHGNAHLLVNAGVRMDLRDGAPSGNPGDRELHGDMALTVPIAGPVSVELAPSVVAWHWGDNPVQQSDYIDASNALALKVGARWAAIYYTDFSNNPLVDSVGNVSDDVYMAGELQYMPTSSVTLKAFYGAYRAGIRCAGGQCRQLPGFEGARLTASATF